MLLAGVPLTAAFDCEWVVSGRQVSIVNVKLTSEISNQVCFILLAHIFF